MTSPEQIKAVALDAWAAWGSIDVLVNNAGYALIGALEEYDESQMQRCLDTNFWGPIRLIRALLPHLREARRGHLVHVSAAAALGNYPGFSIYGAAKLAMEGVFESLAQELRPFGIRTTLIQPGPFRTDFIRRSMESARHTLDAYATTSGRFQQYLAKVDGKQPGDPERAAALLVRLIQSGSAPTRLVLGNYAIDKARKRFKSLEQDLVAHEADCRATDRSA
jgi:NAD(P)-dependent dehydrogenase (short-subunit alcohol dehydrogenase family)